MIRLIVVMLMTCQSASAQSTCDSVRTAFQASSCCGASNPDTAPAVCPEGCVPPPPIYYISDGMNWNSVFVGNLIVAKLIQRLYSDRPVRPSNFVERGVQMNNIHRDMDLCSVTAPTKPAFDVEFWSGAGAFQQATIDLQTGVTNNSLVTPHFADQVEGWLIADNALNSNLTGMSALKQLLTSPTFNATWTTPPPKLVDALNNVIASNVNFTTFYAAPQSWDHSFETAEAFASYGINITIHYPEEGDDYGLTDFISTLITVGSKPVDENVYMGFAWAPHASSAIGTTYLWTAQPARKLGKLKTQCFGALFPLASTLYERVRFNNADVAMFSYESDINGRSVETVAEEWLMNNTERVAQWLS